MDGEQQLGSPQRAFRKDLIAMFGVHIACRRLADGHLPLASSRADAPVLGYGVRHELS
ncbi:hypothetical protein [Collinsella tanakaei]|jgi:hypothetical protein|uniref:hypothetical protein n=1 Tax=Collinsella tanakaei TaxID=626935 RepID=UPI0015F2F3FC|nr:hypothetical protein [Collinsella tanakaei]